MGPATTIPSDVTTYLTAAMALMRQIAVRSQFIYEQLKWNSLLSPPRMEYHPSPNKCFFLSFSVMFSLAQHCNTGLFPCHNGLCVPQRYVCDHDDDCGDRSDELNCSM